jgi:integrase
MGRRQQDPDQVSLGELSATPMRARGEQDGKRYWRVRGPRPERPTLWTGWATRAEVEVVVAELVRRGTPARRSAREDVRTVGDLLTAWVRVQEQRLKAGEIAPRSLTNYRQGAGYWRSAIADVLVVALTRELVEDTLRGWRVDGVAPRTCAFAADVLRAVVKWGAPRGHCSAIGLRDMQAEAVDDEDYVNCEYTPTRPEAERVVQSIPPGRDRDLVHLLLLTGARVGEAPALQVGSWDRRAGELLVSGRDRRRGRRGKVSTRRWPVLQELGGLLERLCDGRPTDDPLVPDLPLDCSDLVCRVLERACEVAEVERFTSHGIRRLVAMELLDAPRSNPKKVSKLTGHSVAVLMRSYVRPRPEELRDLVARTYTRRSTLRVVGAQDRGTADDDGGGDDAS